MVEASAKEKGVTTGSLIAKINELHNLGLLRGHLKEAAHEVRFGGNEAAHGDLAPVDHETAEVRDNADEQRGRARTSADHQCR
ncbi:DUF4145 domain-containing protein [Streptomyces sp. NPDC051662]|uniref:DUF4145 domain-containing protein n=1 Tax=Streptomyces sp. NPDC051662 TaxID=3154750 RepID=UPI00342A64B5